MKLEEIKAAVAAGKRVCWKTPAYQVVHGRSGYLIGYLPGTRRENYIGLTHRDGVTMNGDEADFYIEGEEAAPAATDNQPAAPATQVTTGAAVIEVLQRMAGQAAAGRSDGSGTQRVEDADAIAAVVTLMTEVSPLLTRLHDLIPPHAVNSEQAEMVRRSLDALNRLKSGVARLH